MKGAPGPMMQNKEPMQIGAVQMIIEDIENRFSQKIDDDLK